MNPYAPGAAPPYLAGRERELQLIRERFTRLKMLGSSGGPLLAFCSPRGRGKTSLLAAARRDAIEAGFLTVAVTGQPHQRVLPELVSRLAEELRRDAPAGPAQALIHRLDQISVEVGVPGLMRVDATVNAAGAERVATLLREVLEDAALFALNHDMAGLFVFVDEFQELSLADRSDLLVALQQFEFSPRSVPVAVVAAGLPTLPEAVVEASTFGERSRFEDIQDLSPLAVAEALKIPAQRTGVDWSNEAVAVVIEASQGYAYHVQLIGEETWQFVRPQPGEIIQAGHARAGVERAAIRLEQLHRARFSKATGEEGRFLTAMALVERGGVAARAAIAEHLGVESRTLSRVRDQVIAKGFVEARQHGVLAFTVPGFGDFLRARAEPTAARDASFPDMPRAQRLDRGRPSSLENPRNTQAEDPGQKFDREP